MKREIELNKNKVEYTLKISNRAKKIRLAIHHDGNFTVTVPENIKENIIETLLIKKTKWIISKLEYFKKF